MSPSAGLTQTAPGGLLLAGTYHRAPTKWEPDGPATLGWLVHTTAGPAVVWNYLPSTGEVYNKTRRALISALRAACRAAGAAEEPTVEMEMDHLQPQVVHNDDHIVVVVAYRESEAAQAAFDAGYRAGPAWQEWGALALRSGVRKEDRF